jgi:hypothetical protein
MAGSFGFEDEKYDVSVRIGERLLLPAVRRANASTIVVADGFSCREQIAQLTGREALHTAEVLSLAMHHHETASHNYPERSIVVSRKKAQKTSMWKAGLTVAAIAIAGVTLLCARTK